MLINLSVNNAAAAKPIRQLESLKAPRSAPDYGSDDLHNARLIGAYHAHKEAGGDYLLRWRASLGFRDRLSLSIYEQRNTNIGRPDPLGTAALTGIVQSVDGEWPQTLAEAAEKFRRNLDASFVEIGKAFVACWLARRWPVWALPALAWVRLQNQMVHEGGIMLEW